MEGLQHGRMGRSQLVQTQASGIRVCALRVLWDRRTASAQRESKCSVLMCATSSTNAIIIARPPSTVLRTARLKVYVFQPSLSPTRSLPNDATPYIHPLQRFPKTMACAILKKKKIRMIPGRLGKLNSEAGKESQCVGDRG